MKVTNYWILSRALYNISILGTIPSPPMSSAQTPSSQSPIGKKPQQMMGSMNPSSQQHQNMMQPNMGPVPNHMNMQHMQQQQQHSNYMQQVSILQKCNSMKLRSVWYIVTYTSSFNTISCPMCFLLWQYSFTSPSLTRCFLKPVRIHGLFFC